MTVVVSRLEVDLRFRFRDSFEGLAGAPWTRSSHAREGDAEGQPDRGDEAVRGVALPSILHVLLVLLQRGGHRLPLRIVRQAAEPGRGLESQGGTVHWRGGAPGTSRVRFLAWQ